MQTKIIQCSCLFFAHVTCVCSAQLPDESTPNAIRQSSRVLGDKTAINSGDGHVEIAVGVRIEDLKREKSVDSSNKQSEESMEFAAAQRRRNRNAKTFFLASMASENETPGQREGKIVVSHRTNSIAGWTVLVSERLLAENKSDTERALDLLRVQLEEIVRVVPAPAVAKLREVTLWFSSEYLGVRPTAEYHPGAGWLREHGRDPAMVKSVEFTNVRTFEAETRRMPNFTLHELAHAFHDRVLARGFDNPEIKAAYERAKASKSYEHVERWFGNGRPNTQERAYAMTNPMEYFAETTEAFFARNDFFPFTHDELKQHDPEMEALLSKLWGVTK